MSELGLNDHHQGTIINYMRFARYQRDTRMRSIAGCFEDHKASRLNDTTFTIDEVQDMIDDLMNVVAGEVETELINTAHTNVLLLRQVFQQAEQWHLKLQADISELENMELLEKIKEFENSKFCGVKSDTDFKFSKLTPIDNDGAVKLLTLEIGRLKEDNDKLKERLKEFESQTLHTNKERHNLSREIDDMKIDLEKAKNNKGSSSVEVRALEASLKELKTHLDDTQSSSKAVEKSLETDLTSTKHELLKIREMLEMAEKELEKKVHQTGPFKNLKSMMLNKNEQIKELRKRLAKYEELDN